jgi:hypothetical protein
MTAIDLKQMLHEEKLKALILLALVLLGCSRTDDLAGYDHQSGDLGVFILQHASKFGARVQRTNALPQFTGDWRYKEDADGFQVYIAGDHFGQLHSFLTAAFGPPARPPTTNEMAGTKSIGTFYGAELGVALTYGWEATRDGKEFTSMVVVRQK